MIESLVNSKDYTRYLYISKKRINIIKVLLFECIYNLLKVVIIFNCIKFYNFIFLSESH